MHSPLVLALDIGGTKLAVAIARLDHFARTGELLHIVKEPIPSPGTPDVVIPRALQLGRELATRANGSIVAAGISIGGPLDHTTGMVLNFPHLPGWKEIPLCDHIREALGVPTRLDNDANLGALAENRWGAGRDCPDVIYLTISTGIGGGIVVNNRLLHGIGSAAGEVGHITVQTGGPRCTCGNPGCLEIMASGTAIARRTLEALAMHDDEGPILRSLAPDDLNRITAAMVFQAAREGDRLAERMIQETAEYIAIGLASIIHVLAPPLIVLGGGVVQAGEELLAPIRQRLRNHVFYVPLDRIRVEAAQLGHDSAIIGAATLALDLIAEIGVNPLNY